MTHELGVDLEPGKWVGPFKLGTPLPIVIDYLRKNGHAFPHVDCSFNPTVFEEQLQRAQQDALTGKRLLDACSVSPPDADIALVLRSWGTTLRFDFHSQRLKLIQLDLRQSCWTHAKTLDPLLLNHHGRPLPIAGSKTDMSPSRSTESSVSKTDVVTESASPVMAGLSWNSERTKALLGDSDDDLLEDEAKHDTGSVKVHPESAEAAKLPVGPQSNNNDTTSAAAGDPATISLRQVADIFGKTRAPLFVDAEQSFVLRYPGMCFLAPATSPKDLDTEQQASLQVSHLLVFYKQGLDSHFELPPLHPLDHYFEPVIVNINHGIEFSKRRVVISFSSFTQHITGALGSPSGVYPLLSFQQQQSQEERQQLPVAPVGPMGLPAAPPSDDSRYEAYILSYPELGMDFVMSGRTHRCSRMVLHTNHPSHHHFHRYRKCNFRIKVPNTEARPLAALDLVSGSPEEKSIAAAAEHETFITSDTPWGVIRSLIKCHSSGQRVFQNHATKDAFQPVHVYATSGATFEVTASGLCSSVTLFCDVAGGNEDDHS